jgi:hypothetical protein
MTRSHTLGANEGRAASYICFSSLSATPTNNSRKSLDVDLLIEVLAGVLHDRARRLALHAAHVKQSVSRCSAGCSGCVAG